MEEMLEYINNIIKELDVFVEERGDGGYAVVANKLKHLSKYKNIFTYWSTLSSVSIIILGKLDKTPYHSVKEMENDQVATKIRKKYGELVGETVKVSDILNYLYYKYVNEDKYKDHVWHESYKKNNEYIKQLRQNISNSSLKDDSIIKDTKLEIEQGSLESFYRNFWLKRSNGVASVGQGNFSKEVFGKIEKFESENVSFVLLNELIIKDPSHEQYRKTVKWFNNFKNENPETRMSPSSINRFFSAQCPEKLTTISDEGKLDFILAELGESCDGKDWYEKNELLMSLITDKKDLDDCHFSLFFWYLYEKLSYKVELKKQVIYYGAPGTGKTYSAQKLAREKFNMWKIETGIKDFDFGDCIELIQFHPSFTYEDFIEGIKPEKLKDGKSSLALINGVFKEFCREASRWEREFYDKASKAPEFLNKIREKDYFVNKVTVGDIKKLIPEENPLWNEIKTKPDKDKVSKYIPPYFFIVDEINRAEISRVFGELMYCLEYRGYSGKIKTQYSGLVNDEKDSGVFYLENGKNYFFIPNNIYLLGTMNTIDRSVESFDFAMRRRFNWERVDPDIDFLKVYLIEKGIDSEEAEDIQKALADLNKKISMDPMLGKDFEIGHTYLFDFAEYGRRFNPGEKRNKVWKNNIRPLLEEYLRGIGEQGSINNKIRDFGTAFGIKEEI